MERLTKEALDAVASDPILFGKVCKLMNLRPTSLPMTMERNGNNINRYSVVLCIAEHLQREPKELVKENELEYVLQS